MSKPRYPEEFKIQAVNQVTEKKPNGSKTMISTLNCVVCEPNSRGSPKSETS